MQYLFTLFFVIIICSCNKNKDNNSNSWKTVETFTFNTNKQIDTVRNISFLFVQVTTGSNIVFRYNRREVAPPTIADGGSSQDIYFEVPVSITNFTYTDAALANVSCFFSKMCFCDDVNTRSVNAGTIHGEKNQPRYGP